MANERTLVVKFIGDASSLKTAGAQAEGSLGKLKTAALAVGATFAAGFVADKAVNFLEDSAKAAEEDKKSQALLATQLRNTNNATKESIAGAEKQINALSRMTGVADDELRPAFATLARATGDTNEAQRELALAMDIAAGKGIDLETVTNALEKAHNGSTTALTRLGIATKDAEGNTLTLTQAMDAAQQKFAGAAEAAVTPGARMSVAFHELQEQVGTALLPVLENLSTFMADTLLPAFQNAIVWIQTNWPQIEADIKSTFDKIKPWLDEFVHSIQLAFDIIKGVFEVVSDLLQGHWSDAWRAFKDMIGNVFGDIVKLVGDKVDQIKQIIGAIVGAVSALGGQIAAAAVGMWNGIVDETKKLPGQIAAAAVGMFDGIYSAFKSVANDVIGLFNRLLEHIGIHVHINPPGPGEINFDWQAPEIAKLAAGGIVSSPMLALLGESGPEAVVPLGRGGGAVAGMTVHIANATFTATTASELYNQLVTLGRQNGGIAIPGGVRTVS